nr:vegetative cell wall protein gp1-like [Aegilops tauschii subsp. strangulata]
MAIPTPLLLVFSASSHLEGRTTASPSKSDVPQPPSATWRAPSGQPPPRHRLQPFLERHVASPRPPVLPRAAQGPAGPSEARPGLDPGRAPPALEAPRPSAAARWPARLTTARSPSPRRARPPSQRLRAPPPLPHLAAAMAAVTELLVAPDRRATAWRRRISAPLRPNPPSAPSPARSGRGMAGSAAPHPFLAFHRPSVAGASPEEPPRPCALT